MTGSELGTAEFRRGEEKSAEASGERSWPCLPLGSEPEAKSLGAAEEVHGRDGSTHCGSRMERREESGPLMVTSELLDPASPAAAFPGHSGKAALGLTPTLKLVPWERWNLSGYFER